MCVFKTTTTTMTNAVIQYHSIDGTYLRVVLV